MQRKLGVTPERTTTSNGSSTNGGRQNFISGCEKCVDSLKCTIGDPKRCSTGIVRELGWFGTNFTSTPISRSDFRTGGTKRGGVHHK